jgi:hypothetical protein
LGQSAAIDFLQEQRDYCQRHQAAIESGFQVFRPGRDLIKQGNKMNEILKGQKP